MDNFNLAKLRDLLPSLPQISPPTSSSSAEMGSPFEAASDGVARRLSTSSSTTDADTHAPDPRTSATHDLTPTPSAPSILDPQPIDESRPKTNLDLVSECDSFPYFQSSPQVYLRHYNHYYHLQCAPYPQTLGYILPSVAEVLRGIPGWHIDDDERTLTLVAGKNESERTAVVAATTGAMKATGHFRVLKGWRNEMYPVYGPPPAKELLFSMERSASPLFGIVSYGVHMTAYTYVAPEPSAEDEEDVEVEAVTAGDKKVEETQAEEKKVQEQGKEEEDKEEEENVKEESKEGKAAEKEEEEEEKNAKAKGEQGAKKDQKELRLWIPRRAATKQTYGGMLDNTVAGGMATGETPLLCVVREASEEASLPEAFVKQNAKPAGTVSYFHIRDHRAGGETGLLQPEVQFIYDLELPDHVKPAPCDDEVEQFYLLSVPECKEKLAKGEFKPNCAAVLLDFFVRWGFLTADEESDYVAIVSRLHRVMEFPTM